MGALLTAVRDSLKLYSAAVFPPRALSFFGSLCVGSLLLALL